MKSVKAPEGEYNNMSSQDVVGTMGAEGDEDDEEEDLR